MVVDKASIMNIMGGMESTAGVRLHNHRRKLRQRFDIIKKLGQGTYGKVQLGINKETGQEVAIKTIKKSKIESEADLIRIRREIQIMSSVQHPNIIHIYEVFENREKMVLVMEYAAGGELYDFLSERKVLAEEEAQRLFRQIATAVYYCHKHKICHRDLKLENILLDETGSAKIADFGLSNVFDETRLLGTFCGSPLYASPEIVQGTPYHGPEVDCWSLGVLLYTLVYGAMPFDGSNFKRLVKQISQGDYFEPKKPSPASPLIRDMLTVSPAKRADIVKICSHWWVNQGQSESCLDIAEHLANQTPVRLDLLLSLAPPVSADQVVVTTDQKGNGEVPGSSEGPVRSHSVGSLMDLDQPSAEKRIRDFVNSTKTENSKSRANLDKAAETAKRKLEDAVSTEDASVGGAKKKERSRSKQRSTRTERRSSSRSKKPNETMDVESESIQRSDSKELTLAAASAINDILQDKAAQQEKGEVGMEKKEEKRKSTKGVKKKTRPGKDEATEATAIPTPASEPESGVAEGTSGSEPTQEAKIPSSDAAASEESSKVKVKRKTVEGDQSKIDVGLTPNEKLSDTSPSDESVRSSQSEPCVEEIKDELNGDDASEGVVSIMSSSTAPPSSMSLSNTNADIAGVEKAKSQGKISLSKIICPSNEVPIAVPVPDSPEDQELPRSTERRKSKIFETAEKFNNLANTERKGSIVDKPKKIHIPGVKVSDAKAAFERKSSITASATSVPSIAERKGSVSSLPIGVKNSLSKKTVQDQSAEVESSSPRKTLETRADEGRTILPSEPSTPVPGGSDDSERAKKVKEAVGVISSVIEGQKTGRKVSLKKTPQLSSFDGSKTGTPSVPGTPLSPTGVDPNTGMKTVRVQVAPNDIRLATIQVSTPQATKYPGDESHPLANQAVHSTADIEENEPKKTASKMEITLKSATLPRRKTSEAKIQMGTPPPAKASSPEKLERMIQAPPSPGRRASVGQPLGGYRSEVEHIVGAADSPNRPRHQRSEVSFPVAAASSSSRVHPMPFRSASCEPESTKSKPREHIIPIHFEVDENAPPRTTTPPAKPPVPPTTSQSASGNLPYQRTLSQLSQRSNSLSRQSTQDSDTESTISQSGGEPIRKSPREYIIPIAVEGGGYVTPRATSLEPSEDNRASTHSLPRSRLGSRAKRMSRERHRTFFSSLLSESEDESPFASLHRHSSIGRDSDNEDRPGSLHLHRLRSSRPSQRTLEHTDSMSSAEEEDDDEGFELLTAENLFSSLLSRVRSLTQRLNVEDGGRPGFPSSRLLSQFSAHPSSRASPFMFPSTMLSRGSPFEPLSRRISETSRSFSRNDSESGSVGPTPWRRSASRDVSDTDSLYSESHNSGTIPKGRSSADFNEGSSLSSYSYTPSLAARLAQYQQGSGPGGGSAGGSEGGAPGSQTPSTERQHRLVRSYMKSKSTGAGTTLCEDSSAAAGSGRFPHYGSQSSYSSARRVASGVARALEEELNGLNIPTSYLPTPSISRSSVTTAPSDDGDVYSSAARRLGLSRTLSMRERSASPGVGRSGAPPVTYFTRSALMSPSRRPFSYTSSLSDSGASVASLAGVMDRDRPPLPSLSRRSSGLGTTSLGTTSLGTTSLGTTSLGTTSLGTTSLGTTSLGTTSLGTTSLGATSLGATSLGATSIGTPSMGRRSDSRASDDDCMYYEILPSHRKTEQPAVDSLTRSCPSGAFLEEAAAARIVQGDPSTAATATTTTTAEALEQGAPLAEQAQTELQSLPVSRVGRSVSVTRELGPTQPAAGPENGLILRRSASTRGTPERSILSKFFRSSSSGNDLQDPKPQRRISRFLRPDFFDTPREESAYAKEQDMQRKAKQAEEEKERAKERERRPSTSESGNKTSSRFLQSLERKLERLRTGQQQPPPPPPPPPPPVAQSTTSRIESTIRSLRERSVEPKEADAAPTESSLLKRAVSVSDLPCSGTGPATSSSPGTLPASRIAGRVLSLFRKDPADVKQGLIPSFRPHKKYTGSTSDSLLLTPKVNGEPALERSRVAPGAAATPTEPATLLSPDCSIVLPHPDKTRDKNISSRSTVSKVSGQSPDSMLSPNEIIPCSVDMGLPQPASASSEPAKTDDREALTPSSPLKKSECAITNIEKKKTSTMEELAYGDVNAAYTNDKPSSISDQTLTNTGSKPLKVSRTKSGSKMKGLQSSKSKTVKSRRESEPISQDGDRPELDLKSITKAVVVSDNGGESLPSHNISSSQIISNQLSADPEISTESKEKLLKNSSKVSEKALPTDVLDDDVGMASKSVSKSKVTKNEESCAGPFVRSFSKSKVGGVGERSGSPRKSTSKAKVPTEEKVLNFSQPCSKSSETVDGLPLNSGVISLSSPVYEQNGSGPVIKSPSKVKILKTEPRSSTSPTKSASRAKIPKDESKECSVVKSLSKSLISKEDEKVTSEKGISPLKSSSRTSNFKGETKTTLEKESAPAKSPSKSSLRCKELKPSSSKETSLLRSSSKTSVQKDNPKSNSLIKSLSRTGIAKDDSIAEPHTLDARTSVDSSTKETSIPPLKSSSRSKLSKADETTLPPSKSSVLRNSEELKGTHPMKSNSKSKIFVESEKKILPIKSSPSQDAVSSLRKSLSRNSVAKEEVSPTSPSRSSSRTRISKEDSPSKITPKTKVQSTSQSPSKSRLDVNGCKSPPPSLPRGKNDVSPLKSSSRSNVNGQVASSSPSPSPVRSGSRTRLIAREDRGYIEVNNDQVRSTARSLKKSGSKGDQGNGPGDATGGGLGDSSARRVRALSSGPGLRPQSHSPSPGPGPSPRGQQGQQAGIARRSRGLLARPRSSSHSRPASSSGDAASDIPVVSFKDVERRHREMLLDKWSKSLQSLHLEAKKEKEALDATAAAAAEAATAEAATAAIPAVAPSDTILTTDSSVTKILDGEVPLPGDREATERTPSAPSSRSRPSLHLDLSPASESQLAQPTSPTDSWSVFSEREGRLSPSPSPSPTPHSPSAEEAESVSDRIRRKSFYSRFNDIKKKKKPTSSTLSGSLSGSLGSPSRSRPAADDPLFSPSGSRSRRSPVPAVTSLPLPGVPALHPRPSGLKYIHNGGCGFPDSPAGLLSPTAIPVTLTATKDRSPTWERSGIELRNDLMFHNLGLHRFDPNNLSINKDSLLGMLSPTALSPAPLSPTAVPTPATSTASELATTADPEPVPCEACTPVSEPLPSETDSAPRLQST